MKNQIKGLFILIAVMSTFQASAFFHKGGNGGDAVVCYDKKDKIVDVEFYDHWNANLEYNFIVERDDETPYMEQVSKAVQRIRAFDPILADFIERESEGFSPEIIGLDLKDRTVKMIPFIGRGNDGGIIVLPDEEKNQKCKKQIIERMASFKMKLRYNEAAYLLSQKIWNHSQNSARYATVMHETLYKWTKVKLESENSRLAQYLNALYSSQEFLTYSVEDYISVIKQGNKKEEKNLNILIDNILFTIESVKYDDFGKTVFNGFMPDGYKSTATLENQELQLTAAILDNNGVVSTYKAIEDHWRESVVGRVKVRGGNNMVYTALNNPSMVVSTNIAEVTDYKYKNNLFHIYPLKASAYESSFKFDRKTLLPSRIVSIHCSNKKEFLNFDSGMYVTKDYSGNKNYEIHARKSRNTITRIRLKGVYSIYFDNYGKIQKVIEHKSSCNW